MPLTSRVSQDPIIVSFACPGFETVASVTLQLNNTRDQPAHFKHTVRYSRRAGKERAGDGLRKMKRCSGRDALRPLRSSIFSSVLQEDMMRRRPSVRARVRLLCLPDTWKCLISSPGGGQIVGMRRLTERETMRAEWSRKSRRQSVRTETHARPPASVPYITPSLTTLIYFIPSRVIPFEHLIHSCGTFYFGPHIGI